DGVGVVLVAGNAVVQLAAGARPARGARLRRRPRALPPARAEPLAALLAAARVRPARLARLARLALRVRAGDPRLPAVVTDRWATFDCYGTLVDWNGGIRAELARVFG